MAPPGGRRWARWLVALLFTLLALLALAWALVPPAIHAGIHRAIAASGAYAGGVADVDLSIVQRRLTVESIKVVALESGTTLQDLEAKALVLELDPGQLVRGRWVGEVRLEAPRIVLRREPGEAEAMELEERLEGLPDMELDLKVTQGELVLLDRTLDPPARIELDDLSVDGHLTSVPHQPSRIAMSARWGDGGQLELDAEGHPLASPPSGSAALALRNLDLTELTGLLEPRGLTFRSGSIDRLELDASYAPSATPRPRDDRLAVGSVDLRDLRFSGVLNTADLRPEGPQLPQGIDVVVPALDVRVAWDPDEHEAVLAWATVHDPIVEVRIPAFQRALQEPTEEERALAEALRDAPPFEIPRMEVRDGTLVLIDRTLPRNFRLAAHDLDLLVEAFGNQLGEEELATAALSAELGEEGTFLAEVAFDPLVEPPTFDLDAQLSDLSLPTLNPVLDAWIEADVSQGRLSVSTEIASQAGQLTGYTQTLIEDVDVTRWRDVEEEGALDAFWEGMIAGAAEVLENQPTKRLGTRAPLAGTLEDPSVNVWRAVVMVLHNAFVEALTPGRADRIGLEDVG